MKNTFLISLLVLLTTVSLNAQTKEEAKAAVDAFFEAFHKQDTIALGEMTYGEIKLNSISEKSGENELKSEDYGEFLKAIASIPKTTKFEERLLSYEINVDSKMANVWTPYEFYLDNSLSHCGVNNFQLIWVKSGWKIINITDTRSKDCD